MTTFTGMFNYPATNRPDLNASNVSARGTITLKMHVDAAAAARSGSIWGHVTGDADLSNYVLNAVTSDPAGFPHMGNASATIADVFEQAPDIDVHGWTINTLQGQDAINFDGNYFVNPTISNGLNLDGNQITGKVAIDAAGLFGVPPDITTNVTLTSSDAVPTLYNLAEMAAYVEGLPSTPVPPVGWTASPSFQGSVVTFANADSSEIVIDIRGTVPNLNIAGSSASIKADLSFVEQSSPDPAFRTLVQNASTALSQAVSLHPQAHITISGHSLGGAIAQLLGFASGFSTVAYDAPGAMQFYNQLQNELAAPLALGAQNTQVEGNVDVRVVGDAVSLVRDDQTIDEVTLNSTIQPFPDLPNYFLDNHSMNVILTELKNPGTTISQSIDEPNSDIFSATQNIIAAASIVTQVIGSTSRIVFSTVGSALQYLIDPSSGSQFIFNEAPGSPAVTSVTFFDDPNVSTYRVWSLIDGTWSSPQTVSAGGAATFGAGASAIKFEAFSSTGQVLTLPDGFLFDATFASAGQVNARLESIDLDNLNGVNVQTPMTGQTTLNVSSSFNYTDAGNGNLTVNGTASGNDTIVLGSGNKTVNLGTGNDIVTVKTGATGNVVIHGGAGDETILAGAANVTLIAGSGNILFVGGDDSNANVGVDTIDYSAASGAVTVNLATGIVQTPNGAINTLVNVENVTGSPFGDVITGDSRANALTGGAGDDTLIGGAGRDTLNGGSGHDILIGGPGADKFILDTTALNDAKAAMPVYDEIADYDRGNAGQFNAGEGDQIDLSALLMTAYNKGSGQAVGALVRALVSGNGVKLQADPDGTANGANWTTIAQLDGLPTGASVNVILDPSLPGGTSIPTFGGTQLLDFNADGASDAVWRNTTTGEVDTWLLNNGRVVGGAAIGTVSSAWQLLGSADVNSDRTRDLLWRNGSTGEIDTWLMNNGHVTGGSAIGTVSSPWQFAGAGDFLGNGTSDLLWRNTTTGEVDTWLMNNGRRVGGTAIGTVSSAWQAAIGDVNGDGTSDIVWLNTATGEVDTWLMNNGGRTGGSAIGQVSTVWQLLGTGDFNGDGTSDLLWRNSTTGEVDTWLLNNGRLAGGAEVGSVSSAWQFVATGDYNGDGTSDVLWRNSTTGEVDTWLMNNGHIAGGAAIGNASTTWARPSIG